MRGEGGTEADKLEWACRQIEALLKRQAELEAKAEKTAADLALLAESIKVFADTFGKYVQSREALRCLGL